MSYMAPHWIMNILARLAFAGSLVAFSASAGCSTPPPAYGPKPEPYPTFPPPSPAAATMNDSATPKSFQPTSERSLAEYGIPVSLRLPEGAKLSRAQTAPSLTGVQVKVDDQAFIIVTQYPEQEAFETFSPAERLNDVKEAQVKDGRRVVREEANDREFLLVLEHSEGGATYFTVTYGQPDLRISCATSAGARTRARADAAVEACRSIHR